MGFCPAESQGTPADSSGIVSTIRGVRARAARPASSVSEALADTDEPGAGAAQARAGSSEESEIPREADVEDIAAIRLITCYQQRKLGKQGK